MANEIPRRCRLDLLTPAETAIYNAMQAVEALPADVRLTRAVCLLSDAKDRVADYVDDRPYELPTERMRAALQWIASQENLFFAECSLAEEIVERAKTALRDSQ